jgi:hypothetical protein
MVPGRAALMQLGTASLFRYLLLLFFEALDRERAAYVHTLHDSVCQATKTLSAQETCASAWAFPFDKTRPLR